MENIWFVASVWLGLALFAGLTAAYLGISAALAEILVGVAAGNLVGLHSTQWIDFLAMFGSGILTFLAGAEIDPISLRRHLKASLLIGLVSFLGPFLVAWGIAAYWFHWTQPAAAIAGVALSTTSVAVVYAVMVERGLAETDLGKLILAACFVTDLGTVLALGLIFANFNAWMALFVAVASITFWFLPSLTRWVLAHWSGRLSELDVKFIFLVLVFLGGLATSAKSEAVLPAYLMGLVVAGVFLRDRSVIHRIRSTAFSLLTPFYFIKAGVLVSLPAVATNAGIVALLLIAKVAAKGLGVWPVAAAVGLPTRERNYTTLLMSTGLTFGTISALFGLTNGYLDQTQYTILVTVVILSAILPTLAAQAFFQPVVATGEGGGLSNAQPAPVQSEAD
ncbi:MAG: cation:proton antiporter [Symbiobacteriia bacterium]